MKETYAIAYYRKSIKVTSKKEKESVAYQKNKVHEYAEVNGMKVLREFSDVGYSGTTLIRPELQEMLDYITQQTEKIDEILIYSVDRLGRDLEGNIEVFQQILQSVEKVTFVSNGLSTGNQYFTTFFLLLTAFAEEERKTLQSRLKDGRRAKILGEKKFNGTFSPLGLVKQKDHSLVPAKIETTTDLNELQNLEIIRYIFHSYLFNKSLRQIAKELNERFGMTRRGKAWDYKSVRYILSNPAYVGVLRGTHQKTEHYFIEDSQIQPIFDPMIYKVIQLKLENETTGRKKMVLHRIPFFCVCSFCGGVLSQYSSSISCDQCEIEVNTLGMFENIEFESETIINKKLDELICCETEKNKVLKQQEIKLMKLQFQINKLLDRQKQIIKNNIRTSKFFKESGF